MSLIARVDTGGPGGGGQPPRPAPPSRPSRMQWMGWVLAMVLVVSAVTVAIVAVSDEDETTQPATTTTSSAPTTTTPQTMPTTPVAPTDTSTAVYPSGTTPAGHADPVAAARGFAVDFIGFVDPVVGEFRQGDSQAGEVEIRPSADGPVTTVMVRRFADSWWVLGAATRDIDLREPEAMATITSPLRLRGVSTAFEANVSVEIRQDGSRRPVGNGFVMGGSMGELAAFDAVVTFGDRFAPMGAIVLYTASMETGNVWEAAVVRVRFAPAAPLAPPSACPDYSRSLPEVATGQMVVTVYFTCGVDGDPVPTYRLAATRPAVLRAALDSLLAGPTAAETEAGLATWFSPATADMLDDVVIRSGAAVVDFRDLRRVIPSANSSAGSRLLLSQLDATVFQFASVRSVVYRLEGDCEAFNEWLQFGGCEPRSRGTRGA